MSSRRAPPPPPCKSQKPGNVCVYRALHTYNAQRPDELSFESGDILYVRESDSKGSWWKASCGDATGLIPYNYVSEHSEQLVCPLHEAARRGNLALLRELVAHHVLVNGLDSTQNTPLHWASRAGHLDCVRFLLETSVVGVNCQNNVGETALHLASCHGHNDIVGELLSAGADPKIVNKHDQTAEHLAKDGLCRSLLSPNSEQTAEIIRSEANLYGLDDSDSD